MKDQRRPLRPFETSLRWMLVGWAAMLPAAAVVAWAVPVLAAGLPARHWLALAISSLIVAVAAVTPAMVRGRLREAATAGQDVGGSDGEDALAYQGFGAEFVLSALLRLVGTVVLFMLCRYHMAASDRITAAWLLAWYVYLVTLEVISLARTIPKADPSPTGRSD
ncbi:hypothetical protein [Crateriforma spongiae]|uniref:hypothetical protein n=1 Tax=Crateriforma spongiae TaxID=2724528 RepID=UPI0014484D04|nr:hypothetical protein [Crateriforma spongiae]